MDRATVDVKPFVAFDTGVDQVLVQRILGMIDSEGFRSCEEASVNPSRSAKDSCITSRTQTPNTVSRAAVVANADDAVAVGNVGKPLGAVGVPAEVAVVQDAGPRIKMALDTVVVRAHDAPMVGV